MNNNLHKRLEEIEDRKIEILQEISEINRYYREEMSRLSSEFEQLDEEYYNLRLELITQKDDTS
jgi:hypothetical protein